MLETEKFSWRLYFNWESTYGGQKKVHRCSTEIKDKISLVKIGEIREFHEFKSKYEWLERKFGLIIK